MLNNWIFVIIIHSSYSLKVDSQSRMKAEAYSLLYQSISQVPVLQYVPNVTFHSGSYLTQVLFSPFFF